MQLDIILTSLQDHTHVASLLGYSCPADGPEVLSSGPAFTSSPDPAYGATAGHPDTHLAEILMKTLLRNLGFYTVSARPRMLLRLMYVLLSNKASSTEGVGRGVIKSHLELTGQM